MKPKFPIGSFVVSRANREAVRIGAAAFGAKGLLVLQVLEILRMLAATETPMSEPKSELQKVGELLWLIGLSLFLISACSAIRDIDKNVSKIAAALEAQSARKEQP